MLKTIRQSSKFMALLAGAGLFTGCASLDTPIHEYYASESCNLNSQSSTEPYHMRFEIVEESKSNIPGYVHLANTKLLEAGSEALIFSGNTTSIDQGSSETSQVWVLASLGQNKAGNLCLKTRTATRPSGLSGEEAISKTILSEHVYDIEMGGSCGEAISEESLPGYGNTKLRISSAPKSTAEYLNDPETAMDSSCAQLVDSLPPEKGNQFRSELKSALGV